MVDGKLTFDTSIDTSGIDKGVDKITHQFNTLIKGVATGYTGKALIEYFIGSNAQMEQYLTSFTVMLGDAKKAQALMNDITTMAANTPFETKDLTKAGQLLLNYGVAEDELINKMTQLGDLSAGNAEKLNSIALAYGQMLAKGKVSGEELGQMTEAGVSLLQPLSDGLKVSTAELQNLISAGKVGIPELNAAIDKMTSGSGKFAGMMEMQSKTMSGMLSTLKDEFDKFGREAGEKAFEKVKSSLEEVMTLIDQASTDGTLDEMAEELGNALNTLVTALIRVCEFVWEYRDAVKAGAAALIAFNVAMKGAMLVKDLSLAYKVLRGTLDAATAAQLANNAAVAANPYALIATAIISVIALLGTLITTAEKAHEKTESAIAEYENLKSEVEDLGRQLLENKKRIEEIQAQGKITLTDREEIERLQEMNAELSIAIEQKKILEQAALKEADRAAVKELSQKNDTLKGTLNEYYNRKQKYEEAKAMLENISEEDKESWQEVIDNYKKAMDEQESRVTELWGELSTSRNALLKESENSKKAAEDFDGLSKEIISEFGNAGAEISESSREYGQSLLDGAEHQSQGLSQALKESLKNNLQELETQHELGLISDNEYYAKAQTLLQKHNENMRGEYMELWGDINRHNRSNAERAITEQERAANAVANKWKLGLDSLVNEAENAFKSIENEKNAMADRLASSGGLFEIEDDELYVKDIRDQINELKEYQATIDRLRKAGASKEFLADFAKLDMSEANAYAESMFSGDIDQYFKDWEEKQKLAEEISQSFYEDEVNSLKENFTDKLAEQLGGMPDIASQLGADTAKEFVDGFNGQMAQAQLLFAQMQAAVSAEQGNMRSTVGAGVPMATVSSAPSAVESDETINVNVTLEMDGEAVAEKTIEVINNKNYTTGRSVIK